ncbi:MAG TPA: ATP-binding cassette domain-containing protein, partial [Bacteroidetes bacterium]|nr:ATP-binding cassette domain-containing protein [Bacteroidota bacterium]
MENGILKILNFYAGYNVKTILTNINLSIPSNKVISIMGPSGCGKTTLIRCINRMHELQPDANFKGQILLNEKNIFATSPILVRRKIGMVFQKPNPFPT